MKQFINFFFFFVFQREKQDIGVPKPDQLIDQSTQKQLSLHVVVNTSVRGEKNAIAVERKVILEAEVVNADRRLMYWHHEAIHRDHRLPVKMKRL